MNIDKRGIKRGNCMAENCDCELFEYEKQIGPNCSYCSCPPTKHQKIGVSEESIEENSVLTSSFENDGIHENNMEENSVLIPSVENNGIQAKDGYTIQHLVPVSMDVVFPTVSSSSSLQDLLPKRLPKAVEEGMNKKALTPQLRNKIVRSIAERCFEQGVSSNIVNVVADLATQKWSPLKSRFGEPSASLALQIRRRISKLKLHSKKSKDDDRNAEEIETHAFNQEQMKLEMDKQTPSLLKLKQFLDATRGTRVEKVNHTPALQIILEYPALKIPDLLLWEFTKIINLEVEEMIVNWKSFLDKLKSYLKETENFTPVSESYETLTLEILTKLPSIVPSGKRTTEDTKFVLQIHEDNTLNNVMPAKCDPPRLIGIGDVNKGINLFAFVDGTPVFSEKCPIKSLLMLLATYWVFNIQFVAESKPALQVISYGVLREKIPKDGKTKNCSGAVEGVIKALNL